MKPTIKQPYEDYTVAGDFSEVMAAGETISVAGVSALNRNQEDASEIFEPTSVGISGQSVSVRIFGGIVQLSPYKLTFRVQTSVGDSWEVDGQIIVVEK
jgi:hypothetical protein